MRILSLIAAVSAGALSAEVLPSGTSDAAREVIARRFGEETAARVRFGSIPKNAEGCDTFTVSCDGQTVTVSASSPVAQCKGFYTWIRENGLGFAGWAGNRCAITADSPLPKTDAPLTVASPVAHHYYFNVVTYGYTLPFWNWERWQEEIDWMALHGLDMPLALVANEAIATRVWRDLGLTHEEIDAFYTGPAHLPWQRMGNITGFDGPLPEGWNEEQIALQHKILARMRTLGMKPICPAFAGFIPAGLQRVKPELKPSLLNWAGFPKPYSALLLSPEYPLFREIGSRFIREWEKEFGTCGYYLADSFNEMDLPKGTGEALLARYGEIIYRSIADASPDAVWVMQGWMLGYQRGIWSPANLKALLSRVPDEKMLLLDLAADYNKHWWKNGMNWDFYSGFFNKPWVYSVIPNMGGKTAFTGYIDFYANGHLEALRSPNRGHLAGIGMAPEGIENNEMLYELLTDAGWKTTETDPAAWYREYARARYGACPQALEQSFALLRKSVYGSFHDHPRYNWQHRPVTRKIGSANLSPAFFEAVEAFASARAGLMQEPLYRADLAELTGLYLAGRMEQSLRRVFETLDSADTPRAESEMAKFLELGALADAELEHHPTLRLSLWEDFAATRAPNARRLITLWGPPLDLEGDLRGYIEDYSARVWGGVIRDFYLPRWRTWFANREKPPQELLRAIRTGELDFIQGKTPRTRPLPGDLSTLFNTVFPTP